MNISLFAFINRDPPDRNFCWNFQAPPVRGANPAYVRGVGRIQAPAGRPAVTLQRPLFC